MPRRLSQRELLEYLLEHGPATNSDICKALNVHPQTAKYHLEKLMEDGIILKKGEGYGAKYYINPKLIDPLKPLLIAALPTGFLIVSILLLFKGSLLYSIISLMLSAIPGVASLWLLFLKAYREKVDQLLSYIAKNSQ